MNTSFFFFAACRRITSVPCTLVSMVCTGSCDDQLHADGRGQVEDHRGAIDELGDQRLVEHAVDGVVEAAVALEVRDVVDAPGGQIVEDEDFVAALEQRLGEMRADEAGSASDQDAHGESVLNSERSAARTR